MALEFKGLQKTTLIDFPGQIACTVFLPKCDFRCGFCYNISLVKNQDTGVKISEKEFLDFLETRKNFLDGVCITGGEPTLHSELPVFCRQLKDKGFLVKLDTNGSNPKMLDELVRERLVDFVAMDIKAGPSKYSQIAGVDVDMTKINQSIEIIKKAKEIDYEFRTTLVPLLEEKDLLEIGAWLNGSKKYVLQQFNNNVPILDSKIATKNTHSKEEIQGYGKKLGKFFKKIEIRGT
ncbi:MAG: anaerobic ribonucleoside-triphosphate reductase activating protein [Candidatus Diapherotrites archaeon]|nr:anaerobic ribonucleoside-triphosphate reductase activating protein [Candidatus Diapherotrites archaeon]